MSLQRTVQYLFFQMGGKLPWKDARKVYQNMFIIGKIQNPSIMSYAVQKHCLGTMMYKAIIYNSVKGAEAAVLKSFQHKYPHTYTHAHTHTCMHTHTHACKHARTHAHTHTHIHTHTHTHTHTHIHTHTQTHTHTHTPMHAHTHTYVFIW